MPCRSKKVVGTKKTARPRKVVREAGPRWYLNTYAPLVASKAGRIASLKHGIPPFVDGSIRREPDLEHTFPSISCLCRGAMFAPRLRIGDTVGYMTRKGRCGDVPERHRRLTAILQVLEVLPSHEEAATWYRSRGLPLPNNCMLPGNPAKPIDHSHRIHEDNRRLDDRRLARVWDAGYRLRASLYGDFVVCHALFRDLSWNAPIVEESMFLAAFGRVPATRNPGSLPQKQFQRFLDLLGVSATLSNP